MLSLLFHRELEHLPQPHNSPVPVQFTKKIRAMYSGEVAGLGYITPANTKSYPVDFNMMQTNTPTFHFDSISWPSQYSYVSNTSTSDEAEEQHPSRVVDERKQRRMVSNRESARRSRMRKQRHLDELWLMVVRLRTENCQLIEKLNHVSDCHDQVVQENTLLREEASELHQVLNKLKLEQTYTALDDLKEVPCNTGFADTSELFGVDNDESFDPITKMN